MISDDISHYRYFNSHHNYNSYTALGYPTKMSESESVVNPNHQFQYQDAPE